MELTKIQIILDDSGNIIDGYSVLPIINQYATNYLLEVAFKNEYEEPRTYKVVFNIKGSESPAKTLSPTTRTITLSDGSESSNVWEYQLTQYETQYYQDVLEFSIITANDTVSIGTTKVELDMVKNRYNKLTPVNLEQNSSIDSVLYSVAGAERLVHNSVKESKEYVEGKINDFGAYVQGEIGNLNNSVDNKLGSLDSYVKTEIGDLKNTVMYDLLDNKEYVDGEINKLNSTVTDTVSTLTEIVNNTQSSLENYVFNNTYRRDEVDTKISELVNSAPETLNTLNELSKALGDDPNFATTVSNKLGELDSKIGNINISDKLTEYVKFTDYASSSKAGVISGSGNTYAYGVNTSGVLVASNLSLSEYDKKTAAAFMSKGTLENIKYNYVKTGLVSNDETWSDDDKSAVADILGSEDTKANQLVKRSSAGQIAVPLTPDASYDATSKDYVDNTFISKPSVTGSTKIVTLNSAGVSGTLKYSSSPASDSIPVSNSKGNIKTNTPIDDRDCTTKKYVDDKFNILQNALIQSNILSIVPVEDEYYSRITAGGLNVVNESNARILKVEGNTVKGNNVLSIEDYDKATNGIQITVKDNKLTFKGTATGYVEVWLPLKTSLPQGNYSSFVAGIAGSNVNGLSLSPADRDYNNRIVFASNGRESMNITTTFESKYLAVYISMGNVVDCSLDLMLNEGETSLPYEKYFTGLKHARISGISSTGRNLINQDLLLEDPANSRAVYEGFDCIKVGPGFYTIPFSCKANTNVRMSLDMAYENGIDTYWFFQYADGTISKNSLLSASNAGAREFKHYVLPLIIPEKDVVGVLARRYGNYKFYIKDLMLNYGTTDIPYEPYTEETLTFTKTELGKWDSIDFEKQKLIKGTETVVFDGTENWEFLNTYISLRNVPSIANANNGICNLYPYLYQFAGKCIFVAGSYLRLGTALGETFNNDVAEWKAHLAELYANGNPLMISYELATPSESNFTAINEYKVYNNGSEIILGNDATIYGAENTLTQEYLVSTEV